MACINAGVDVVMTAGGLIGFARDVSWQKQMETLERAVVKGMVSMARIDDAVSCAPRAIRKRAPHHCAHSLCPPSHCTHPYPHLPTLRQHRRHCNFVSTCYTRLSTTGEEDSPCESCLGSA